MRTEEEFVAADKYFREYSKAAAKAAEARSRLPAGSSRARVTSANARWARAAEARDARERSLREQWQANQAQPQCDSTDAGDRCVYGAAHAIRQHSDGDRRWAVPSNSEESKR